MNDSSLQLQLDRKWKQMYERAPQRAQGSTAGLDEQHREHQAKPTKLCVLAATGARFPLWATALLCLLSV